LIKRRIRYIVYSGDEFDVHRMKGKGEEMLLLWKTEGMA
jgi:hypothetical protein